MHTVQAPRVPRRTAAAAAVVLSGVLAAGAALSGCEYVYDDGRGPLPSATAPPFTDAALPQDPRRNLPVSGAELDAWVEQVLPDTAGQVFHTGFGLLQAAHHAPGEHRASAKRDLLADAGLQEPPQGVLHRA